MQLNRETLGTVKEKVQKNYNSICFSIQSEKSGSIKYNKSEFTNFVGGYANERIVLKI